MIDAKSKRMETGIPEKSSWGHLGANLAKEAPDGNRLSHMSG